MAFVYGIIIFIFICVVCYRVFDESISMNRIYNNMLSMITPTPQSATVNTLKPGVICCLTRGYTNINRYSKLISRNNHLSKLQWASKYDHKIFHEGNIPQDHQQYILDQTSLPIEFVNIEHVFKRPSRKIPTDAECRRDSDWPEGYKRMCRFWFVDFWEYIKEYEYMIRFDEDVLVDEECTDPIEYAKLNNVHYLCPYLMGEPYEVIDGLDKLTGISYEDMHNVPSTHTQLIHVPHYIDKPDVREFIDLIDSSGCILYNRWGDAPLMGILVRKFTKDFEYEFEWKGFKGYHGSHDSFFLN